MGQSPHAPAELHAILGRYGAMPPMTGDPAVTLARLPRRRRERQGGHQLDDGLGGSGKVTVAFLVRWWRPSRAPDPMFLTKEAVRLALEG
jgi:hypothetical protein